MPHIAVSSIRTFTVIALLVLGALMVGASAPAFASVEPAQTLTRERVLFDDMLSGDSQFSTTYSNIAYTRNWNYADVFLLVTNSDNSIVFAIPQVSADGLHWADAALYGRFETAPDEIEWLSPDLSFHQNGNGAAHKSFMLAGRYLRVKLYWIGSAQANVRVMFRQ
jgi:hypothetical protein